MADDLKCLQYEDQIIVIHLQAWFRGILRRKWMRQLRDEYAVIFQDLEPEHTDIYNIEWKHSGLCKPSILKSKRQKRQDSKCHNLDIVHKLELKSGDLPYTDIEHPSVSHASSNVSRYPATVDQSGSDVSHGVNPDPVIDPDIVSCDIRSKSINKKHVTLKDNRITDPEFDRNSVKRSRKYEHDTVEKESHCDYAVHADSISHEQNLNTLQLSGPHHSSEYEHKHDNEPSYNNDVRLDTNKQGRQLTHSVERSLGHMTDTSSVWDVEISDIKESDQSSFNCEPHPLTDHPAPADQPTDQLPRDTEKLGVMRQHVAMELLWVKQAIQSRKQYLRLKSDMGAEL